MVCTTQLDDIFSHFLQTPKTLKGKHLCYFPNCTMLFSAAHKQSVNVDNNNLMLDSVFKYKKG